MPVLLIPLSVESTVVSHSGISKTGKTKKRIAQGVRCGLACVLPVLLIPLPVETAVISYSGISKTGETPEHIAQGGRCGLACVLPVLLIPLPFFMKTISPTSRLVPGTSQVTFTSSERRVTQIQYRCLPSRPGSVSDPHNRAACFCMSVL